MARSTGVFSTAGVGVQTSDVRLTNQRVVLTAVSTHPGSSAAELSRQTKLAPQTVAAILLDLETDGLIKPGEVIRGKRGQPATPYFINPSGAYSIGVEIGWHHIEGVLVNIGGEVLAQYRRDYAYPDARVMFTELAGLVAQFKAKLPERERSKLLGAGVAAPGGIGRNVGLLQADPEIGKAWQGVDLREKAEEVMELPVALFNDGNAACWAELGSQPSALPESFAYILVSTFLAAGIVAEGTLWEGPTGNSANLGSMLVTDQHGDQNFVHLLASIYALEQRLSGAGIVAPPTNPMFWPWGDWEPYVSDWLAEASLAIAQSLINTAAVIEVGSAVVDGVMPAAIVDRLIAGITEQLEVLPTLTFDSPTVTKGHLGGAAPSTGAAYLPLFRRYFSRDLSHVPD